MSAGHLALILHAHLPFVRHPEHEDFLEENWLNEAITETYIPLIGMMQRLLSDGVDFRLTMSVTPTLCAMLQDRLLRERYVRYIERAAGLAEQEAERADTSDQLRALSMFYAGVFALCRRKFVEELGSDLLAAFRKLQESGCLEIIACAATHAFLPALQHSPEALRAQLLIGRDVYRAAFGRDPAGIWLPECGYTPAVDRILQEANIRWFVVDTHGLMFARPQPRFAVFAPCFTPSGPAAFARDRDSSREVWSATEGYPGHTAYRDFYRDAGFDLPLDRLAGFLPRDTARRFTGLKFHRVTGGLEKALYDPAAARIIAENHAQDFLSKRRERLSALVPDCAAPIVVAPFDAELFGHWWYEGPLFLEALFRRAADDPSALRLTTPSGYLQQHPTQQIASPAASSWGENGYSEMWINKATAWIYPHLHGMSQRMTAMARKFDTAASPLEDRLLKQLGRELLLAQSSDWAFLIKTGTAAEYATQRTRDHIIRFDQLYRSLANGTFDEEFLADCEGRDNLFPDLIWRYFA